MGHLFRSLNLADALMQAGHGVRFLVNDHVPSVRILREHGHRPDVVDLADEDSGWEAEAVTRLGARVWVNDRLDTDAAHVRRVKAAGVPVATFDDRGDGAALSDLNVAALAFAPDDDVRIAGRRVLRGVDYLVLNPLIANFRRQRSELGSVLVTLGGSDTYGVTLKALSLLSGHAWPVTVVVGPGFAHHAELDAAISLRMVVKRGVPSMIEEMAHHDLAITGGGITPFEANAAGLPCIVIANEDFEVPVGLALQAMGGCRFAGHHAALDTTVFQRDLPIRDMSRMAMENIGLEGTRRVVEALEGLLAR